MLEVVSTDGFASWLRKLKDRQGRLRILARIDRLADGNPGDVKPVGRGVSELRLTYGPGYRVYFLQDGHTYVLLLCGGDKSTQQEDIKTAHKLADEWRADQGKGSDERDEKYQRFDPADYLDDLDDVVGYLAVALEESAEDPTAVPRALGVIARSKNMSELARRVGMSRDGLYKALSAEGNPTWSTILKVTNALGLRFELHTVA